MQHTDPRLTIETFMASSKGVLEAATKWQEELLRFVGKRMNGYVELARDLQECRSPTDVLNLQTGFVRQMLSDYRAEAEWITRQFLQAEKPAQRQIDRAFGSYEETILKAQRDAAKIIELAKDQAARILENAEARPQRKAGRGKKTAQG
jgi:hypothetical protein